MNFFTAWLALLAIALMYSALVGIVACVELWRYLDRASSQHRSYEPQEVSDQTKARLLRAQQRLMQAASSGPKQRTDP